MQILTNEPLKDYTNYKIGGNTPKMFMVKEPTDFKEISDEDLHHAYILGGGTNILVSDKGIENPVVKVDFQQFLLDELNQTLTIGAGMNLCQASRILAEKGFKGLTHLSGIPGTIGGAVCMNASASHGTISDYLIDVEAFNQQTRERKVFTKSECRFGFRSSIFQNSPWIIVFVRFQLEKNDSEELLKLYNEIIAYRDKNYPLTFPSAGCWFKRDWGGKDIIEKIHMSGAFEGSAVVSPLFPSFILNVGKATAQDVYSLVTKIQEKAKEIGEEMPLEVVIWGKL